MRIGNRVRLLRVLRGLSQGDVSKSSGLAPSYISNVECGRKRPSLKNLMRLAPALQVRLDDFFREDAPPPRKDLPEPGEGNPYLESFFAFIKLMDPGDRAVVFMVARRLAGERRPGAGQENRGSTPATVSLRNEDP